MVWYGGPFSLHTCPVRELDVDADYYLAWFAATHHITEHGWVMSHLPGPGGIGAQDALLMQGIALARDEANGFQREQQRERQRDKRNADYFDRIEAESRT